MLGPLGVLIFVGLSDFSAAQYDEWLREHGIGPVLIDVPLDSGIYYIQHTTWIEPMPVSEGILFQVGRAANTCVATIPKTRGVKKLKTQAVIAYDVARLMLMAYDRGVADGSHNRRSRCDRVAGACRRFDTLLKSALLSQEPSFPRKKSKTGVTRQGRKRKGPG